MTDPYLPPEATGSAPGRARLAGRRVLVVGAGTRPSPEPDPPIGNGPAIAVLAAREGATAACADRDPAAAQTTAQRARAPAALAPRSASVCTSAAASLRAARGGPSSDSPKAALRGVCRRVAGGGMAGQIGATLVVPSLVDTPMGREASRLNPARTARRLPFGRQATAWEVAYATVWLLSSEASYINPHPLVLDGRATSFG